MSARSNARRQLIRTVVGALGGLVGGLGATLVLTQSGALDVDLAAGLSLPTTIAGAVLGFIEPPEWVLRAVGVAILAGSLGVATTAVDSPASAQSTCSLRVAVDGRQHDLHATSRDDPLVVDIGSEPVITFEASAPGVARGLVEVTSNGTRPSYGGLLRPGDNVVFFGEIEAGEAVGTVTVERDGWTGFLLVGDAYRTQIVPLGLVELQATIVDLDTDTTVAGCPDSVWVRAVARPIGNGWGQTGVVASVVGLMGVAIAGPLRRPFRLGPEPPPTPPLQVFPAIPGRHPFVEHTEARILGGDGTQVDPSVPLVAGREYQLEITFGAGLVHRESGGPAGPELQVAATSRTVPVRPTIEIGAPGLPITVPLTSLFPGRHDVLFHATRRGHHVQTEQVSFTVVADAHVTASEPQTRSTLINTVDPTDRELERLPERQVLVILIADSDHTVDARITDVEGETIVHYDSPLIVSALDTAAGGVRARLGEMLALGQGLQTSYTAGELADGFRPVVAAGRRMSMALFPDTSVTKGEVGALGRLVADGATVQIVGHRAGLGHATLPWGLIYDRPFIDRSVGNPVCSSFATHAVDHCPNGDDAATWCPTGFWGYRAIVEELWATTEGSVLAPPVMSESDAVADHSAASMVAYLDGDLEATPIQARSFDRSSARRLVDFEDVRRWMSDDDPNLRLLYFYTHHESGGDGGLRIGAEVLTPGTLNAFRHLAPNRWPGRPLVIVNACGSGAYQSTDPVSFIAELRAYGAGGMVTSECTLWDPLAGDCGLRIVQGLADGRTIGVILRDLRRGLLAANNNPVGLAYRLHARADASVGGVEWA